MLLFEYGSTQSRRRIPAIVSECFFQLGNLTTPVPMSFEVTSQQSTAYFQSVGGKDSRQAIASTLYRFDSNGVAENLSSDGVNVSCKLGVTYLNVLAPSIGLIVLTNQHGAGM